MRAARTCFAHAEKLRFASTELATLLNQVGLYLESRAVYAEAEPLYRRALAIFEQSLGEDHPNTQILLEQIEGIQQAIR